MPETDAPAAKPSPPKSPPKPAAVKPAAAKPAAAKRSLEEPTPVEPLADTAADTTADTTAKPDPRRETRPAPQPAAAAASEAPPAEPTATELQEAKIGDAMMRMLAESTETLEKLGVVLDTLPLKAFPSWLVSYGPPAGSQRTKVVRAPSAESACAVVRPLVTVPGPGPFLLHAIRLDDGHTELVLPDGDE